MLDGRSLFILILHFAWQSEGTGMSFFHLGVTHDNFFCTWKCFITHIIRGTKSYYIWKSAWNIEATVSKGGWAYIQWYVDYTVHFFSIIAISINAVLSCGRCRFFCLVKLVFYVKLCIKASIRFVSLKLLIIGRNGNSTASRICNTYVTYLTSHNAHRWQHTFVLTPPSITGLNNFHLPWSLIQLWT
jgi:hypothetical protein